MTALRIDRWAGWLAAAAVAACAVSAPAEVLVGYTFDGSNVAAGAAHHAVTGSGFSYTGGGATNWVSGNVADPAYRSTDWSTGATLDAYFSFSLTIAPGYVVTLTNVTFYEQRSDEGPGDWVLRYSVDDAAYYTIDQGDCSLSFGAQDVADEVHPHDLTGTVYFRLYGTNAVSAGGAWRIDDLYARGRVAIDTGARYIAYNGYDGAHHDNWPGTTNAGNGTVQVAAAPVAAGRGALELVGSADRSVPNVVLDNVDLTGASNVSFSVSFAADAVDTDDDLHLDASYDAGATWTGAGSTQLVDGFGAYDLAFGSTGTAERVPVGQNPYTFALASAVTQFQARVRFQDNGDNPVNDHYYVDSVHLRGVPQPSVGAPGVSTYWGYGGLTTGTVDLVAHVTGGYPYPAVTVYYGPSDGADDEGGWAYSSNLGLHAWGLFTNTLSELAPGQKYYYRFYASNTEGGNWASASSNFTTQATGVDVSRAICVDNVGIASQMPLSIDNDGDGMADAWEVASFGNTSSNASPDADGDGWSNLREAIAGTDPMDGDSYLRVVSVDLASEASDDLVVTWHGGDHSGPTAFGTVGDAMNRRYRVHATDTPGAVKPTAGEVVDDLTGTARWTNRNAAAETDRRYYHVSVAYGGRGYTNTEEWAAYVQERQDDYRYLVSVPVNLSPSNNLNSTLGRQLARGLEANAYHLNGDMLYHRVNNAWQVYYLDDDNGTPTWVEHDGTPADLTMTPGMGFWIRRQGGGTRTRANCVLAGRSFTSGDAQALTFPVGDAYAGWQWSLFGWPFAEPKRHRDLAIGSTPSNQLGFAALGYGGASADYERPHEDKGDQIWVWENNTFTRGYWLMDGIGPDHDGRWWDDRGHFADFSLEPGKAYFYRHHAATSGGTTGVQFEWTPTP